MTTVKDKKYEIPEFGWKVNLNKVFPQRRFQKASASLSQIWTLVPLIIRYLIYYIKLWFSGRIPVMDYIYLADCDQQSGVPFGGIGGGSIGRGFKGEFSRFQMIPPGMYDFPSKTVEATQFILNIQDVNKKTVYQNVLSCQRKPDGSRLSSWAWNFPGEDAEYTALYPRSWTVFNIPKHKIKLTCRQISPIIPHNYKDSSIPGGVFSWNILNYGSEEKYVSITFTLKNGTGTKLDKTGKVTSESFVKSLGTTTIKGITMEQEMKSNPYTYTIAASNNEDVHVTSSTYFDPNSNGSEIWETLKANGELSKCPETFTKKGEVACGVCCRSFLTPYSSKTFVYSLVWDMPYVKFPNSTIQHKRFYTKYFGDTGDVGPDMCLYNIMHFSDWETCIYNWQKHILDNEVLPAWFKSALFNELYYISDGGTVWVLMNEDEVLSPVDPRKEFGRFAYLEGHEYRMYNSYDVHFYASFAMAMLWPKLQLSFQYDLRDSIDKEDSELMWFLFNGKRAFRKVKGTVPHDMGDPDENPFLAINSYPIHDVSDWRDLNLKFVLQVFRDYALTKNLNYLYDMYPQVVSVMHHALSWDIDGDGMIENSGSPDQTYDSWIMHGTSSYCGSLWLASLVATIKMSEILQRQESLEEFSKILEKAKHSFDRKLWNGEYYNFDCSEGSQSKSIMADQLCGFWYLHACNLKNEIIPDENVRKSLITVYNYNVLKYYNGSQGAVNGMLPNGKIDTFAVQSEEVWTGVTYALSSFLIFEGYIEEGFATAKGLYETIYEKSGLGFSTPEAIHGLDGFRSLSYMRPLSIWSIYMALEKNFGSKQ